MNMRITVPDEIDQSLLPEVLRTRTETRWYDKSKLAGLALTVILHVAAIAAIAIGGIQVAKTVAPPPIMMDLAETKPEKPAEPPRPVPLVQPKLEQVPMPEVTITTDPPPSIAVTAVPTPPAKAEPPPPAAPSETQQSYLQRLLAYLNRYMRYPAEAKAARAQGVVMLHFVMDKTGHVTAFDISRSSGKPALDAEALALIQRAQPLPAIPDGFGKDTIDAIVPIEFALH